MTISGYVAQTPLEVVYSPSAVEQRYAQLAVEVAVAPQSDTVEQRYAQIAMEVVVLSFYTEEPTLGDNVNYFEGNKSTDKHPDKVHPGGNVGGGQGAVITLLAFENVQVPQGAIIREAYITFTASDSDATTTVNANIVALDEDSPVVPDTYADLILAPTTTAYALWNDITSWVAENQYNSVEIKGVVQEIVDRVGWERGNTLVILFQDNNSSLGSYRRAYSKLTSGKEPTLTVLWDYETFSSIGPPTLFPIDNPLAQANFTVSWSTVAGATSYELWEQYLEEEWQLKYSGALTSQEITATNAGTWSYRVRAYDGAEYSSYSTVRTTSVSRSLSTEFIIGVNI